MLLEKSAGGVVDGSQRELIADLGLHQADFRLSELSLGLEHQEDLPRTQFVLALFGLQRFLRQAPGDLSRLEREFGFFELVDGVQDVEPDCLFLTAYLVKVVASRDGRRSERRPRRTVVNGQIEL